jgi:phosphoglucomutase
MQDHILNKAREWASNLYFDKNDREEIARMLEDKNYHAELQERFYQDLEFGTGGLRNIIGVGSNRMNKYNIRRASQAVANIMLKTFKQDLKVCLSYDCRHYSQEFAKEAAGVFAANGIKVYIYSTLTPVPMLSYSVRKLGAHAGIMVTASHNPKNYNGFKVYWADGCQVVPPVDNEIIESYYAIVDWNTIKYQNFDFALNRGLIHWMPQEVIEAYYQVIDGQTKRKDLCRARGAELKVVFSPLHGTAFWPAKEITKRMGFTQFHMVESQSMPDANFSTVKSPNPENPEALARVVEMMQTLKADIGFGTDPDSDRLGVVYLENNQPVYLNGNQIAVLMLDYIFKALDENKKIPAHALVIKSIVTSELQTAIAKKYGARMEQTLTGFKWMGALMAEYERNGTPYNFIFASEESFGYMGHNQCRDKDGLSALALMMELTLYHKTQGRNLTQALDQIYTEYGFYQESLLSLDYLGMEGSEKIKRIMTFFRTQRPTQIEGSEIVQVEDYSTATKQFVRDGKSEVLTTPKSNVLGFTFGNGNKLYLRPSGTEPKIKFYTMVKSDVGSLQERKQVATQTIHKIEQYIQKIANEL